MKRLSLLFIARTSLKLAIAFGSTAPQCAKALDDTAAAALRIAVVDCEGFEALPVPMTEDVYIFVDGVVALTCTSVSDGIERAASPPQVTTTSHQCETLASVKCSHIMALLITLHTVVDQSTLTMRQVV